MQDLRYPILDGLYERDRSKVYRAFQSQSSRPVILKVLNQAYPLPEKIARYRLEYDITCQMAGDRVILVSVSNIVLKLLAKMPKHRNNEKTMFLT